MSGFTRCTNNPSRPCVADLLYGITEYLRAHLQGEQHFTPKSLIYIDKLGFFDHEVTDSGACLRPWLALNIV